MLDEYRFYSEDVMDFFAIDLFSVVLDIEKYPDFLPWCKSVYIRERRDKFIVADLLASFKGIKGSYSSYIQYCAPTSTNDGWIKIESLEGIFDFLYSNWVFVPYDGKKSLVKFSINCSLKYKALHSVFNFTSPVIQKSLILAFKNRASDLFS
ncbi:type II toxin-antitoxin system RatA family toxin [Neoehrlichia mikurensis]|uniref:Type II toxin-antitoxin system RatA family toxin n=2 Tax=Neoehrlichia mikurensis TaxID=89586 RepID=A0A9Q9BZH2_9RICK|nr:type II toxin-antitoxin system RatA family toxin [Neoehrlichia mikurensis]QXK92416.1 type II toxin-antitoxin system RatA family toxin [Neoehrlichia mikurensis]QXK93262.1 type II toxin-antitoxin system RatA family toxin [Neoehrlichia mikurensis]QXK93535.1 type II toxin-antitoxin system RatA family toxin [Neoehrlichia mikurensis]UTO55509.1 type II toxin-antitoxin system RatA family toxin [Neoehrlichia mikurensis]UTO56431.1 type II toxin-antitoxin system RatA family toxin [Neoehrlichia mikuren